MDGGLVLQATSWDVDSQFVGSVAHAEGFPRRDAIDRVQSERPIPAELDTTFEYARSDSILDGHASVEAANTFVGLSRVVFSEGGDSALVFVFLAWYENPDFYDPPYVADATVAYLFARDDAGWVEIPTVVGTEIY